VTPKPRIAGAHTALVVGKAGEEIWTDKYGRVVVQFYWDRLGAKDEKSSCWVRVAQGWAGKTWGAIFVPRIGQEVIVSFLDGDPDRPIITGSVYNATQAVPYTLPDDQTKSTVKSNSSKTGGGFNELRFEDKKDSEEIYIHAQKDMKTEVLHDSTTTIKNDRTITVSEGKETHTIEKGDRTVEVKTGNETHNVAGTRTVKVTKDETHTNEAKFDQKVTGDYTLKVTGNLTIEADGDVIIKSAKTVAQKAGTTFDIEAGTALTNKAGTALKNKAGTTLDNEAGTTLTNKGVSVSNEASASMKSKGALANLEADGIVTVKGSLVKIN
jgi:type VI secretion system secreted protein VgrG